MSIATEEKIKCARPNCRHKTITVVSDAWSAIHEHITDYHPSLQKGDSEGEILSCRCDELQTA